MTESVKGVILVGGQGTRLRPLTLKLPKPMVPIVNRPFLEHMLAHLRSHGIHEVTLAVHYLPDHIRGHFGDGREFGVKLNYAVEPSPRGTAGAVKNAEEYLDCTFFTFNGDVFTDLNLSEMLAYHRRMKARATIALTPVEDPSAFGVVETNAEGRVLRFIEKPKREEAPTNMINAGTYVLEPEVLDLIPPDTFYMFEHGLFPLLLERGERVYAYPSNDYWIDIGNPQQYMRLHHDLLMGRVSVAIPGRVRQEGIWVQDGAVIDPTAKLVPPVVIGESCFIDPGAAVIGPTVLGAGSRIGRGAAVEESIFWAGANIGEDASVKRCILGANCLIGKGVTLPEGSVLGDGERVS
ncbi:MAG: NDP-sugar synthase [Chloroflexi bacterium]|nr:NDP-sugar synthase [Chloroflexota bacterium]